MVGRQLDHRLQGEGRELCVCGLVWAARVAGHQLDHGLHKDVGRRVCVCKTKLACGVMGWQACSCGWLVTNGATDYNEGGGSRERGWQWVGCACGWVGTVVASLQQHLPMRSPHAAAMLLHTKPGPPTCQRSLMAKSPARSMRVIMESTYHSMLGRNLTWRGGVGVGGRGGPGVACVTLCHPATDDHIHTSAPHALSRTTHSRTREAPSITITP